MTQQAERHPGPFLGPDLELAKACAVATILDYGNDTPDEHKRIMAGGIWNDHIAVQTALTVIHTLRKAADSPDDDDNTMRGDPMFNRGVQHVVDMLAKTLAPLGDWHAGDGSEDYDCDLEETLRNILAAKGLFDKDNSEFATLLASSAAAADVIERVAAHNSSDPASDDLTVPLAIQLVDTEQKLVKAAAALAIATIPTHLYWLMGKGRTRPAEPLYAVQLIDPESGIAIAEAEAEQLANAIAAAIKKLPETKS